MIVTSALPYANGPIHIGHLAGAYLPADIYVRFQKLMGKDVIYICGTDEHGTPITFQAESQKVSPKVITDKYHQIIFDSLTKANIRFDYFSRTTTPIHYQLAQQFFTELIENGYISTHTEKHFYCEESQQFLPDRYIEGNCPYCGSQARGDECSSCGKWLEADKLINPTSPICCGGLTKKETKHWYLDLEKLQPKIERWLHSQKGWKANVIHFINNWFKEGLKPRAITRDLSWGVPVPLDEKDAQQKVLYVWFDAPIGYMSITKEWGMNVKNDPDLWKQYWEDSTTQLIHFIGKDNIPFHAVVWPGMIMGQKTKYILPTDIPANEYLTINGEKISTSQGNCVWVEDVVDHFGSDYLRFYLAYMAPENKDSDFSWKEFGHTINTEFINIIGNLAQRVTAFIVDYLPLEGKKSGTVPLIDFKTLKDSEQTLLKTLEKKIATVKDLYGSYKLKEALREIIALGRDGNLFFQENEPWKVVKENPYLVYNQFNILVRLLETLAILLIPITPDFAQQLLMRLGSSVSLENGFLNQWMNPDDPAGKVVLKKAPLLVKIEEKQIKEQESVLQKRIKQLSHKEEKIEEIDIDDFKKIVLKTGKIVQVENILKSNKLLKFQIQSGEKRYQILSGIAQYYPEKEVLIGKHIVFVENLKPVKLMGELSEGMILSTRNKDKDCLEILEVSEKIGHGGYVS